MVTRRGRVMLFVGSLAFSLAACQSIIGFEAKELTPSAEGGEPAIDGDLSERSSGDCPTTTKGPRLLPVKTATGELQCVDETEVTQGQYRLFMNDVTNPREQPADCNWNTSLLPNSTCLSQLDDGDASPYNCSTRNAACDNAPQTCIDWCDAFYYCKWAGKRLCGRIGGGAVGTTETSNAAVSQWVNACSSSGKQAFPYGPEFDGGTCYTTADAGYPTLPVKSYPGCVTPDGIYDMSGSVAEWEDSCTNGKGPDDICAYRGGGFLTDPVAQLFDCTHAQGRARNLAAKWRGFRCCFP
jgi:formylglycine-generating enzyme